MNEWWHAFITWLIEYQSNVVWSGVVLLNPKAKWGTMGKVVAKSAIEPQVQKVEENRVPEEFLGK